MDRPSPNNSFVVFQFGDGNTENIMLNLPTVLLNGNTSAPAAAAAAATGTSPPSFSLPNEDLPSHPNNESDDSGVQRNMVLSVRYIYSQDSNGMANRDTPVTEEDRSRTGSVLLNVPNIPSNRTDAQFNALVEFAASIALTAIAVTGLRRGRGITKEAFEKFPQLIKHNLEDQTCPICFEDYILLAKEAESSKKRKREDLDGEEQESHKSRKSNNLESVPLVNEISEENQTGDIHHSIQQSDVPLTAESSSNHKYCHVPIELPCSHKFGQDCLYEWLKSNSTCPLCRKVVHTEGSQNEPPERINLPNITSLLNRGTRDRPIVIFLDRSTNTLTTRSSGDDITLIPSSSSSIDSQEQPEPRPRSTFTSGLLSRLNQVRGTDSIFSSGVASRRTRNGVETVNLDNSNQSDFETFYAESRRLVEQRLNRNQNNSSNSESANRTSYGLFGFQSNGDLLNLNSYPNETNDNEDTTGTTESRDDTTQSTNNSNEPST